MNNSKGEYKFWGFALVLIDWEAFVKEVNLQYLDKSGYHYSIWHREPYTGAIEEFKSALRINYLDNSARIGLVNSYLALASYNANDEKNYEKASCALARPDHDGRRGPHRLRRLRLQQCGSLL